MAAAAPSPPVVRAPTAAMVAIAVAAFTSIVTVLLVLFWSWDELPPVAAHLSFYPAPLQPIRSVDLCSLLADGIVLHGVGSMIFGESLA